GDHHQRNGRGRTHPSLHSSLQFRKDNPFRLTGPRAPGEVCPMPARFQVEGGHPLNGTVRPAGNKNAALPILAASLLADGPVQLANFPRIRDVELMAGLLADLGALVEWTGPNALTIDSRPARLKPLDPGLCARIRAS